MEERREDRGLRKERWRARTEGGEEGRGERREGMRESGKSEGTAYFLALSYSCRQTLQPLLPKPRSGIPELNAEMPLDPLHLDLKSQESFKSKLLFSKFVLSTRSCLHLSVRRTHLLRVSRDTMKSNGQEAAPV